MSESPTPRLVPLQPPFPDDIAAALAPSTPPGGAPLALLTTLARDARLFKKFTSSSLLDRGNLTIRQRELCIVRTSALCGAAYEYGVHATVFGAKAGFDDAQFDALAAPDAAAAQVGWSDEDRAIITACDALHRTSTLSDAAFAALSATLAPDAILEAIMVCGFYHTVAFITNGLNIAAEPFGRPLPT
jgi:alkylhydroperoxidase family enzyme